MANFCSECGEKLISTSPKFCQNCGADQAKFAGQISSNTVKDFFPFTWKFSPKNLSGESKQSFTFEYANSLVVDMLAAAWTGAETLTERKILDLAGSDFRSKSDKEEIQIDFTHLNKSVEGFKSVPWKDSDFGNRFISTMKKLDISFDHVPNDLISGSWELSDGTKFLQFGQLLKSEVTGQEKIYWYIQALIRTRYCLSSLEPHFSRLIRIPSLLQNVFYLCETQFPESTIPMPRNLSFGIEFEQIERIPRPLVKFESNSQVFVVNPKNVNQVINYFAPETTCLGYVIDDQLSEVELEKFLPKIINTLTQVPELLIDGFANHLDGIDFSFQTRVGADTPDPDHKAPGQAGWIAPAAIYGELSERTIDHHSEISSILKEAIISKNTDLLEEMIDKLVELIILSTGNIFPRIVNTLANTVISEKETASESFAELLDYASKYPVGYQDMKALSNLAKFRLKTNQLDLAEEVIERAVSRVLDRTIRSKGFGNSEIANRSSGSDSIDVEILETYFAIKEKLTKIQECRKFAPFALEFAESTAGAEKLLSLAKQYVV